MKSNIKLSSEFLNQIVLSDCLEGLKKMPDNCVDCCISSPPYWGLRDYGVDGQIGLEENYTEFISKLIEIYNEVYRVLKPTGTCFVNLGDTYAGSGSGTTKNADTDKYVENSKQVYVLPNGTAKSSKFRGTKLNKSLLMIPERFSISMIDSGWILRNQIIWHKPNQMPSSAKDRFTVDFEKIFFFVKQSKNYFFNQQREGDAYYKTTIKKDSKRFGGSANAKGLASREGRVIETVGRNMRTVWSINTEAFPEAHFATYPQKLVERMIVSGCPEDGVVLDPFMGAGTTALMAKKLGRNYVGFELNPKYKTIAEDRLFKEFGLFIFSD